MSLWETQIESLQSWQHDFGYALRLMKSGFAVRRPTWTEDMDLILDAKNQIQVCHGEELAGLFIKDSPVKLGPDLLATDWEISRPKLKELKG